MLTYLPKNTYGGITI